MMEVINKKLNFGILISSPYLKRWQLDTIQRLIEEGHQLQLVIHAEYNSGKIPTEKKSKYIGKNGFYHLYTKLIHLPYLNQNIESTQYLSSFPTKHVDVVRKGKYTDTINAEQTHEIKEENLDFILRFGLNIIRGEILQAAKNGIWSLHHDDERAIRGGPPGFWEIAKKHKVNGILLQQLTEKLDDGIPIRKVYLPVIHHSYKAHHNELLRAGIDLILFAAKELSINEKLHQAKEVQGKIGEMYYFPKNLAFIAFVLQHWKNKISFYWKDLFRHENWNLGVSKTSVTELFEQQQLNTINWHKNPPTNNFYADGFLHKKSKNEYQILFENYSYKSRKGTIDTCTYTSNSGFSERQTVLEKDQHLSFPFILNKNEKLCFIPENQASGQLKSYSLQNPEQEESIFPDGAIDAVIFEKEGKWWLLCTFKEWGSNYHLFGYYAATANGPWTPHPLNPLVSDTRKARMAGNIIHYKNSYYRPAQINHIGYGGGIQFMEIEKLDTESYQEKEAFHLKADTFPKYNKGMHTLNLMDEMVLIDAKSNKFVFREFAHRIRQKF